MTEKQLPAEQNDVLLRWLSHIGCNHPAFGALAVYLLTSLSGLLSSWYQLLPFGINVLDYAGPEDFFLTGLKKPYLILASIGLIACLYGALRISNRYLAPTRFRWIWDWAFMLTFGAIFVLLMHAVASLEDLHSKLSRPESLSLVTLRTAPQEQMPVIILKRTGRFVLVTNPLATTTSDQSPEHAGPRPRTIRAIPLSNVDHITENFVSSEKQPPAVNVEPSPDAEGQIQEEAAKSPQPDGQVTAVSPVTRSERKIQNPAPESQHQSGNRSEQ